MSQIGRPAKLTGVEKRQIFSRLNTQAKFALELEIKMERHLSFLYSQLEALRREIDQLKKTTA